MTGNRVSKEHNSLDCKVQAEREDKAVDGLCKRC